MDTIITIKTNRTLRKESDKMIAMPTEMNLKLWEKISRDADEGKDSSGPFFEASDLFSHLKI